MPAFILRRLFSSLVTLYCVITLTFFLARLQKGGPFDTEKGSEIAQKAKLARYKLDGPDGRRFGEDLARRLGLIANKMGRTWLGDLCSIAQQYWSYMSDLCHGDLRSSTKYIDVSVADILAQKMPNSLLLGWWAFVIASLGGVALGFVSAMKKDTWTDLGATFAALAAISIPSFITGPLMIAFFGLWLRWFPVGGWGTTRQIVLPAICLAAPFLAYVARLTRNSLLDVMTQGFMRTAKAKGLGDASALARHAMKVAILPVITYLGPMAAYVLTGSFVVESVFNISGAGGLFVNSIQNKDVFILCGAVIVYCALILLFNFIVDILYGFLDKRICIHA